MSKADLFPDLRLGAFLNGETVVVKENRKGGKFVEQRWEATTIRVRGTILNEKNVNSTDRSSITYCKWGICF